MTLLERLRLIVWVVRKPYAAYCARFQYEKKVADIIAGKWAARKEREG